VLPLEEIAIVIVHLVPRLHGNPLHVAASRCVHYPASGVRRNTC